ncbi:unnamed protein product [Anisakis simplex]|uniref:SIS domain-containing protein n=1 Tax=Anisakis simplex TaxID=6269 RepID=A0A0M3KC76_ANISI|nr:unnamed protein product [Anisakis simplex]
MKRMNSELSKYIHHQGRAIFIYSYGSDIYPLIYDIHSIKYACAFLVDNFLLKQPYDDDHRFGMVGAGTTGTRFERVTKDLVLPLASFTPSIYPVDVVIE